MRLTACCALAAGQLEKRSTREATRALARREGERVEAPQIAPARARSLEAMAIENAVEGCVRETYGAVLATRDAVAHPDPAIRAALKPIARDEMSHARLAWAIAAWLEPRLDPAARVRVRAARDGAVREIVSLLASTSQG